MRTHRWHGAAVVTVIVTAVLLVAAPASAEARRTERVSGVQSSALDECGGRSGDLTFELSGSLQGCWYVDIASSSYSPVSGVYREAGTERFEGCLVTAGADPVCGAFANTYTVLARFEPGPEPGQLLFGGCRHPIVPGSGEGGFEGATGILRVEENTTGGLNTYTGNVTLPG